MHARPFTIICFRWRRPMACSFCFVSSMAPTTVWESTHGPSRNAKTTCHVITGQRKRTFFLTSCSSRPTRIFILSSLSFMQFGDNLCSNISCMPFLFLTALCPILKGERASQRMTALTTLAFASRVLPLLHCWAQDFAVPAYQLFVSSRTAIPAFVSAKI